MQGRGSGIQEGEVSEIPEGEVVAFSWANAAGRGFFLSRKIAALGLEDVPAYGSWQPLSHDSPKSQSSQIHLR